MSIIFPNGEKEITVASGSKLAVLSDTAVKIYKKTGYANLPDTWAHFATTTAGTEYLSAAVSAATVFRVEAGAAIANYATGVSACDAPVIIFFTKSLCPGASIIVK